MLTAISQTRTIFSGIGPPMLATMRLHASDNMTTAAVESGFADATHYSHAFRDTFGVNPAPVFRKIERFERLV